MLPYSPPHYFNSHSPPSPLSRTVCWKFDCHELCGCGDGGQSPRSRPYNCHHSVRLWPAPPDQVLESGLSCGAGTLASLQRPFFYGFFGGKPRGFSRKVRSAWKNKKTKKQKNKNVWILLCSLKVQTNKQSLAGKAVGITIRVPLHVSRRHTAPELDY